MSSVPLDNGPHFSAGPQVSALSETQLADGNSVAGTPFPIGQSQFDESQVGKESKSSAPEEPDASEKVIVKPRLDPAVRSSVRADQPSPTEEPAGGPLNRVREVREQQGVSLRSMSRRLGVDIKTCRKLEDPHRDLKLSELQAIQAALEVPLQDLLVDRNCLSRPVEERAKMIRIMKTAVALKELKSNPRASRMVEMLCEQLVDLMPELAEVSGWPQFGARRGKSALGRVLSQQIDMSQLYTE